MSCLAAEPLHELLVVRVALVEDLYRYVAPELFVHGKPDVRHTARAELAFEAVAVCEEGAGEVVACHGCRTLRIRRRGQECLHDLARDRGCRSAARQRLILEHDRDREL